jgi:hypothetical protein
VTVDGSSGIGNGFNDTGNGDFQSLLWASTGLDNKLHQVTLTDTSTRSDRPWLDLDFIVFTLGDGDSQ